LTTSDTRMSASSTDIREPFFEGRKKEDKTGGRNFVREGRSNEGLLYCLYLEWKQMIDGGKVVISCKARSGGEKGESWAIFY